VRVLIVLVVVLVVIALVGFWLARVQGRRAAEIERRNRELESQVSVWVDAERKREEER
jgi:hypothetical protein